MGRTMGHLTYYENPTKRFRLLKIVAFIAILISVFLLGALFQSWGGTERLAPIVINFLRRNIFGDEFVLKMEKKVFSLRDAMKQKQAEEYMEASANLTEVTNPLVKQIIEDYLSDHTKLGDRDQTMLKELTRYHTPNLEPIYPSAIVGEGVWEKFFISPSTFKPLYQKTFIRTDLKRGYSRVYLYKFDLDRLKLEHIPGKEDTEFDFCNGEMSDEQRRKVRWIFSGGFQYIHGYYGMKYKNRVVLPPREKASTLLFYKDGSYKISEWKEEFASDPDIFAYRQNEFPLIIDGKITPMINKMWGLTPKDVDPIYTVRSGLGFNNNNEMIFAFGDNLSAKSLAEAMVRAGVVNGMHLDMNYYNVHLVNVARTNKGRLKTFNEHESLSYYKNIYSRTSDRDYFILTDKE